MLIVLDVGGPLEDRIDERDLRQGPGLRVVVVLLDREDVSGLMVTHVLELQGERDLRVIDLPRHVVPVELLEGGRTGWRWRGGRFGCGRTTSRPKGRIGWGTSGTAPMRSSGR